MNKLTLAFAVMVFIGCGGEQGQRGLPGEDGDKGLPGNTGVTGDTGNPGVNGTNGENGAPGSSCTVTQTEEGALIVCEDGSGAMIWNGAPGWDGIDGIDGENGQDGVNGEAGRDGADALVEIIDPCGPQSATDEVFFRFSDGFVYAVYASNPKIHLVRLVPGDWVTTDQTGCYFTFTSDNTIVNQHN